MKRRRKRLSVLILVFTFLFGISGISMANSQQDLSPLTPQQQEAYNYLSSLPPGWLSLIADEFGIAESELIPLYKSGMNYGQIRSRLLELYPVPEISFSYEDCAELAAQTGIDELEAITCYDMAYKWRKDPVWLADLFQRTGSWDIVESAFERWEQSSEKPSSNISTRSIMSMASSPSQIDKVYEVYNVSAQSVDSMMRSGADVNDIRNILFFMDITSAEDQLNATAENSLISAMPFSSSPSLYMDINTSLEEGWIDELPEEINYLNESWPKREFPQELLPLLSDTNENLLTRSVNMDSSDLSMNLSIPQLTFADSELPSQSSFFSDPTGLQPEIVPSAASSDSDGQYSSRGLNIETMYGEDKASPFKSYFTGTSERINPHSGTLLITVNDFSLDEKLGPDFNFTRYFNGSQNVLEQVLATITQGTRSVSSGTTQNSYSKETEYQDGSKRKDVTTVNFEYDAQTTGNGYVNGTAEVENTAYFYRQGETTPYAVNSEDTYSGEAYMLPASASVTAESSVSIESVPATYDKDIFGFGHGWGIDGIPVMDIEGAKKYITLGSEGTYEVGSDGFLVGRDSQDVWVEKPGDLTIKDQYGTVKVSYILKNINNETWYFDINGNPFVYTSKYYGSHILLWINYNSSGKVSEIIDYVGRSIRFTHTTNSITVDIYESRNSTVSLQRWVYNTEPSSVTGKNKLVSVVQPSGQQIFYQYNEYLKPYEFKYNNTNYSHNLKYLNLTSITQPTSLVTNFLYKANDNIIMERYDEVPTYTVNSNSVLTNTSQENRALFSYLTNVTTKTLQRNNGEQGTAPATETWEYDSNDRLIKHKIVGNNSGADRNSAETVETIYTYSSAKSQRPSSIKTQTKFDNTSMISETTESFAYDAYGNIVSHVDTAGNRTDYTYDNSNYYYENSSELHTGCNNLIEKMEYLTYSPTLYTGRRTKYIFNKYGLDLVGEEVAMIEKRQTGTKNYAWPHIDVPGKPGSYIWSSSEPISSVSLILYWTTTGWGRDSQYTVSYRKSGTSAWTVYYTSPFVDGGVFVTRGTRTTNITFPEPGYYDVRIVELDGGIRIEEGSKATGPIYTTTNLSDVLYKSYDYNYDFNSDDFGNIIAVNIYPSGSTSGTPETRTTYTYDTLWHLYPVESVTQVTRADGSVGTVKQTMTYDKLGRTLSSKSEEVGVSSSETQYQYDAMGRVTKIINPPHSTSSAGSEQNITYSDALRQIQATDELGNITRQTYDGFGRVAYTEWKDSSNIWHIAGYSKYDSLGRLVSNFDANFNETKYEYDAFGRQIKTISPDNSQVQSWHVGVNLPISSSPTLSLTPPTGFTTLTLAGWSKVQDADGNVGYKGYDILGRLVWSAANPKVNPEAGVPAWDMTWYEYDRFDRVIKKAVNRTATDWDVTTYGYEYNNKQTATSSPLTVDLPGNTEPMMVYEYNSRGLKVKEYPSTNPSQVVTIEYDELGNTKRITYPTQQEYVNTGNTFAPTISNVARRDEFYYGIYGITRADSYANNMLENSYLATYNQRGWVTSEKWNIDNVDYIFNYGYDAVGNRTSMTYPDTTTNTYTYDELGRIVRIPGYFERQSDQSGFAYDPVGNITDIWASNGIHTQFSYNTRNMATGISSTPLSLSYTYSGNGNIVKITDTTGATPVELNYTYDAKGQLKTAQVNKPTGIETVSYSYDGTSNRISETWKNNQNQILSQYTYTYQPGDYLVSKTDPSSVVNYTWDIYGQLSSKSSGENYIFTGKRNLNSVTGSNTVKEIYTYDALGR